jgi:16S rRNA (guanine966-N2)-methyltransferase
MRIIGGTAGRRLLKVPAGLGVRPTPDLVRQAVFNSLGEIVVGARVLDLFSGSGALGLECLSRGAACVVSVEKSDKHAVMIRQNLAESGLPAHQHELRVQDAFAVIHQLAAAQRRFDLILADPPFGEKNLGRRSTSISQRLLDEAALPLLLEPTGTFVLGHASRDTLTVPPAWREEKTLKHGDSQMCFLHKVPPSPNTSAAPRE